MSPLKIKVPFHKRLFDLLIVIPGSVILLPVIAILAVVVRTGLGSPVLFRQKGLE